MNSIETSLTETETNDSVEVKQVQPEKPEKPKKPKKYGSYEYYPKKEPESEDAGIEYSEDYLYKRSWTKLTSVHKIIKVKEFVNKLMINDQQDKDELKKKLVGMIKTNKLTKKDMVKYDSINGRVIAIPILKYKNGKYLVKSK